MELKTATVMMMIRVKPKYTVRLKCQTKKWTNIINIDIEISDQIIFKQSTFCQLK